MDAGTSVQRKGPEKVDFLEQLPRMDNGKLYKRHLQDAYREAVWTFCAVKLPHYTVTLYADGFVRNLTDGESRSGN